MIDRSEQIDSILSAAVELPNADERADYIRNACGGDGDLQHQVEELVAAYLSAGDFLESPAPSLSPTIDLGLAESAGTQVGRYKLLQQIGEGGFAVVFMAEQEQPVRRRVAVKIIKPGMDSRQVIARFEAERQALAMMEHSNIAKVFDAGTTESGRPYFVMELVKGKPITEYCDEQCSSIDQRLTLFSQVCDAVQHAHQKGVIHRDIKPSNVLVRTEDDKPFVKVIDFGIAKATEARLTDMTLFTEFRQLIGTPAYMSPEQAAGSLDIDTRSDVYSLGVLLYELLSGSPPFDPRDLKSKAIAEMQRIIREVDPPTPSARLNTLDAATRVLKAKARGFEPERLAQRLRGELDWIVLRAMEKDRTCRYQTANGLARDIGRFLADEPVEARAPTAAYRVKKFYQRNKLGVVASMVFGTLLMTGLALAVLGLVQARRQAAIARTEAARSDQIAKFLTSMLAGVGPGVAQGNDTALLRSIMDQTAERVGSELADQPEIEAELCETLATVYRDIGELESALTMFERALALRRENGDDLAVVQTLREVGIVLMRLNREQDAEAADREALNLCRELVAPDDPELAHCLGALGGLLRRDPTRRDESEQLLRQAVAIERETSTDDKLNLAAHLTQLALLLRDTPGPGRESESEMSFREILEIRRHQLGIVHHMTAGTMYQLGVVLTRPHMTDAKQAEGLALLREADAVQSKILGQDHRDTVMTRDRLDDVLARQSRED